MRWSPNVSEHRPRWPPARLLVSDAWNRLEEAAAVAFARTAREVKAGVAVFIRQDLVDIGYLPAMAHRLAGGWRS